MEQRGQATFQKSLKNLSPFPFFCLSPRIDYPGADSEPILRDRIPEVSPHRQRDQSEKHEAVPRRVDKGGVYKQFSAAGVRIVGSPNTVPEIGLVGPA